MRARHCIRTEDDLEPRNLQSLFEEGVKLRNHLLDRRKHFFRIDRRTRELILVEQVILHHESRLRIEPDAYLHHLLQIIVSGEWTMFDLCATGERRRTNSIFV